MSGLRTEELSEDAPTVLFTGDMMDDWDLSADTTEEYEIVADDDGDCEALLAVEEDFSNAFRNAQPAPLRLPSPTTALEATADHPVASQSPPALVSVLVIIGSVLLTGTAITVFVLGM